LGVAHGCSGGSLGRSARRKKAVGAPFVGSGPEMIAPSVGASSSSLTAETSSRALLIGVSDYSSALRALTSPPEPPDGYAPERPDLQDLNGPINDVKKIKEVLTAGGAFEKIDTLPDPSAQQFRQAVADLLSNRRQMDTVLLYYSGHGWLDDAEFLYLCPSDASTGEPSACMIESSWISQLLEKSRAKTKIVILDCCFAGRFKGDSDAKILSERLSQSVAPSAGEAGDEGFSSAKGVMTAPTDSQGLFVLSAGRGRIPDGPKDQPSPFTRILAATLEDMFSRDLTAIDMEVLFNEVKAQVTIECLPIKPSRRISGESVFLARKTVTGARRPLQETGPSWPHLDLTFDGNSVFAKFPDGRTLDRRLITTRRQQSHDSLLTYLLQLATNQSLCDYLGRGENPEAHQVLRNSLDLAYRLTGEDLFNSLFTDAALREELFRHIKKTLRGHSLELRLDMTHADPAIAARRWETMAIPEDAADRTHAAGFLTAPRHGVLIDRRVGVREQRSGPTPSSKSGGQEPRWVLLRSEFAQNHPLAARVQKDLNILAKPSDSPPPIGQPYAQFEESWADFLDHLDDGNILCMLLEVSGSESEVVLRLADANFSQIPAETLVEKLEDIPLNLVVLETLPPSSGQGNGFAAASGLAWSLSQRLACPVVAVSHPHSYVQWLRTDSARNDSDLCTVTGHTVRALCSSPGLDACLADTARKGLQDKAPFAGIPVVYLPNEPGDAGDGHRGPEGDRE